MTGKVYKLIKDLPHHDKGTLFTLDHWEGRGMFLFGPDKSCLKVEGVPNENWFEEVDMKHLNERVNMGIGLLSDYFIGRYGIELFINWEEYKIRKIFEKVVGLEPF